MSWQRSSIRPTVQGPEPVAASETYAPTMAPKRRKAVTTTLEELYGEWPAHPGWLDSGVKVARMVVGDPDDATAPVVFHTYYPPGWEVAPHTHACDYMEIILQGSQQVTGKWHE